jgi:hypothetical protein
MRVRDCAVVGLIVCACQGIDAGPAAKKPFVPTSHYVTREIQGWTVRVNRDLLAPDSKVGAEALRLLDVKLYDVRRMVPAAAVAKVVKIPIWLGVDDGHAPCAEYHPSREWLAQHGYNPDKARAVELGNAERFIAWSKDQPSMVLHELAHGYHHQVLGYDHAGIRQAYRKAVDGKAYESVLRFNGRMERHYALNNEQEYFAEATEALFGTNDYYPFVRAELEKHDPEIAKLARELWGF